jgi:hypothetical protein
VIVPDINLLLYAHDSSSPFLAMDHDAVLPTADTDFVRFQGLRWFNPITGSGSAGLRRTKTTSPQRLFQVNVADEDARLMIHELRAHFAVCGSPRRKQKAARQ